MNCIGETKEKSNRQREKDLEGLKTSNGGVRNNINEHQKIQREMGGQITVQKDETGKVD